MSDFTTLRLYQLGFVSETKTYPWEPTEYVSDDEGWGRGFQLLGHARDTTTLSVTERERLVFLLKRHPSERRKQDQPLLAEMSLLLDRCPFFGPQCFDDIDANDDSSVWRGKHQNQHRNTALAYARARDTAWRELGIEPRWWLSNDRGGMHGDMPPAPPSCTSRHLPRAWGRLSLLVNERAEEILGQPIPIASRLPSKERPKKPPIFLDDGNHNRNANSRGAVWRIGFSRKPDKPPRSPFDLMAGVSPNLGPGVFAPQPTADWSRVEPILLGFIRDLDREEVDHRAAREERRKARAAPRATSGSPRNVGSDDPETANQWERVAQCRTCGHARCKVSPSGKMWLCFRRGESGVFYYEDDKGNVAELHDYSKNGPRKRPEATTTSDTTAPTDEDGGGCNGEPPRDKKTSASSGSSYESRAIDRQMLEAGASIAEARGDDKKARRLRRAARCGRPVNHKACPGPGGSTEDCKHKGLPLAVTHLAAESPHCVHCVKSYMAIMCDAIEPTWLPKEVLWFTVNVAGDTPKDCRREQARVKNALAKADATLPERIRAWRGPGVLGFTTAEIGDLKKILEAGYKPAKITTKDALGRIKAVLLNRLHRMQKIIASGDAGQLASDPWLDAFVSTTAGKAAKETLPWLNPSDMRKKFRHVKHPEDESSIHDVTECCGVVPEHFLVDHETGKIIARRLRIPFRFTQAFPLLEKHLRDVVAGTYTTPKTVFERAASRAPVPD